MPKMRLMSLIRRQAYYRPMIETLRECGILEWKILPPSGRGHPILKFAFGDGEFRIPLPGTPNGHSEAISYVPAAIRRVVRRNMEK